MDSIGQSLREARERKGISLPEARQALCIHASYLDALENDDFDKLPAPVYARAFLRQYARYLDLDPEPLVEQYSACHAAQALPNMNVGWTAVPPSEHRSRTRAASLVLLGFGFVAMVAVAWVFVQFQAGKAEASRPVTVARQSQRGVSAFFQRLLHRHSGGPAIKPVAIRPAEAAPKTPAASPAPGADVAATAQPAPQGPAAPAVPGGESAAVVPAGGSGPGTSAVPDAAPATGLAAKLTARERCWVQIRSDGSVVFEGTLAPGQSQSWRAAKVLDVVAGNAGGVALAINGKDVGSLGKAGEVVHRTFKAPLSAPAAGGQAPAAQPVQE